MGKIWSPVVQIGITDLSKSEGGMPPTPSPSPTTLCSRRVAAEVKGHVTCYIKCFPFAIKIVCGSDLSLSTTWLLNFYVQTYTVFENLLFPHSTNKSRNTPPGPSDISEKNWSTKVNPFLTTHSWYKAMLKVRKFWKPFRIYQLTSKANMAIICEVGLDWLC